MDFISIVALVYSFFPVLLGFVVYFVGREGGVTFFIAINAALSFFYHNVLWLPLLESVLPNKTVLGINYMELWGALIAATFVQSYFIIFIWLYNVYYLFRKIITYLADKSHKATILEHWEENEDWGEDSSSA